MKLSYTETSSSQELSTLNNSQNVTRQNYLVWGHCKQIDEDVIKVTMMCICYDKWVKGCGINMFKAH